MNPLLQNLIVAMIVLLALLYLAMRVKRNLAAKKNRQGAAACGGCGKCGH